MPPPSIGTSVKPPRTPTDNRPANVVAGRIIRGGSGPCYGLLTDDGVEYALHGPGAGELATGAVVALKVTAPLTDVDCGPGIAKSIVTD
ncbi:hypothetical protein [Micromonospora nigra]|uniref:hypothetical protein n=1 Tax=Micromonospora nigra TaxID=145857 RepID=UPI001586736E|nr:hypothetical protein [Micromonospora nigra]